MQIDFRTLTGQKRVKHKGQGGGYLKYQHKGLSQRRKEKKKKKRKKNREKKKGLEKQTTRLTRRVEGNHKLKKSLTRTGCNKAANH